jgi:hypothetical protein
VLGYLNDARLAVLRIERLDAQSVASALLGHDWGFLDGLTRHPLST